MRASLAACPLICVPFSASFLAPIISCSRLLHSAAPGHIALRVLYFHEIMLCIMHERQFS